MNIGELFLNLGIKGTEKTVGTLSGVTKGLGDVKGMSLEAKAGILAAMYGFEQLIASSAKGGLTLQQFANSTGLSVIALQNLQNAARQVGVGGETVISTVKNIQKAMADMVLGGGAQKFLGVFKNFGVAFDPSKVRDTYYMIQKMTELSRVAPPDIMRSLMPGYDEMFAQLKTLSPDVNLFKNKLGPVQSPSMIKANAGAGIAGMNLEAHIKHGMDQFTAAHGKQIVDDMTKITDAIFKLINATDILATKLGVFERLAMALTGVANVATLSANLVDAVSTGDFSKEKLFSGLKKQDESIPKKSINTGPSAPTIAPIWDKDYHRKNSAPKPPAPSAPGNASNVEVNQTLNFQHEGKDATATSHSVKKAINTAYSHKHSQNQVV